MLMLVSIKKKNEHLLKTFQQRNDQKVSALRERSFLMQTILHQFSPEYNNQLKPLIAVGSANAKTPLQAPMEAEDSSSNSMVTAFTWYRVIAIIL